MHAVAAFVCSVTCDLIQPVVPVRLRRAGVLFPTMRRLLKLMHVIGAVAVAGGLAAFMLMLTHGPGPDDIDAYAAVRRAVSVISSWIIVPGMGLGLLSGLLSLAVHRPFRRARWVWVKLGSGLAIVTLTLFGVDATARRAAETATRAAAGDVSMTDLQNAVADPWLAWWLLLALVTANVSMAVWRPRLGQHGVL